MVEANPKSYKERMREARAEARAKRLAEAAERQSQIDGTCSQASYSLSITACEGQFLDRMLPALHIDVVCADSAAERRHHVVVVAFIGFHGAPLAFADLRVCAVCVYACAISCSRLFVVVASSKTASRDDRDKRRYN